MIVEPVAPDRAVDRDILVGDLRGLGVGCGGALRRIERTQADAHGVERPAQVDGGRPRRVKRLPGLVQCGVAGILAHREREAVGRRHADQRRAAHPHVADRRRRLGDAAQGRDAKFVRQPALIDHVDAPAVAVQPNRAVERPLTFNPISP